MKFVKMSRPNIYNRFDTRDFRKKYATEENNKNRPAVNVQEGNSKYDISLAAPGLTKEDFNITLDKNLLVISANIEQESKTNYKRKEFDYSKFERKFELPNTADLDKISASYEAGILKVSITKKVETTPKAININ